MEGTKFETWLGSIIKPEVQFYLAGDSEDQLQKLVERAATIGYELEIKEAFKLEYATLSEPIIDVEAFKEILDNYTTVDIINGSEVKESKPFGRSIQFHLQMAVKREYALVKPGFKILFQFRLRKQMNPKKCRNSANNLRLYTCFKLILKPLFERILLIFAHYLLKRSAFLPDRP